MATKKIRPLGEWVLLKMVPRESNIVLPENVQDSQDHVESRVIAIGDEVKKIKIGDVLLCMGRSAVAVNLPEVEKHLVLIKESSVLGVIE